MSPQCSVVVAERGDQFKEEDRWLIRWVELSDVFAACDPLREQIRVPGAECGSETAGGNPWKRQVEAQEREVSDGLCKRSGRSTEWSAD